MFGNETRMRTDVKRILVDFCSLGCQQRSAEFLFVLQSLQYRRSEESQGEKEL